MPVKPPRRIVPDRVRRAHDARTRAWPARALVLACAVLVGAGATSCGASIQALYEGDVRFEHCMALDARPDVKPTIRRACWEEWVDFYTFGQTRDRIDHARLRQEQLSGASDFDQADWVPPSSGGPLPSPDPVAPPPMMLATDGGAADAATSADASTARPVSDCAADCQQGLDACHQGCKGASCERACAGRYQRCTRRCK